LDSNKYLGWAITKDRNGQQYADWHGRLVELRQLKVLHAAMGVTGEAGELMDAIKKYTLYGKPLDVENVKEELGDLCWYMSLMIWTIGSTWAEVMAMNHDKLEKRYPSGFTEAAAIARADKAEEVKPFVHPHDVVAHEQAKVDKLYEGKFFYEVTRYAGKPCLLVNSNIRFAVAKNGHAANYPYVEVLDGKIIRAFTADEILVLDREL
jgi:NTP pyrophosphatase (non-canonical NTP hydrolase)